MRLVASGCVSCVGIAGELSRRRWRAASSLVVLAVVDAADAPSRRRAGSAPRGRSAASPCRAAVSFIPRRRRASLLVPVRKCQRDSSAPKLRVLLQHRRRVALGSTLNETRCTSGGTASWSSAICSVIIGQAPRQCVKMNAATHAFPRSRSEANGLPSWSVSVNAGRRKRPAACLAVAARWTCTWLAEGPSSADATFRADDGDHRQHEKAHNSVVMIL